MEENKLVPTDEKNLCFDEEISGVRVEKSTRRMKKKKKRGKKLLLLTIIVCLTVIVVKNFSYIKNFAVNLFATTSDTIGSSQESTVTGDSQADHSQDTTDSEDILQQKYDFIDTSPEKLTLIIEGSSNIDYDSLLFKLPKINELEATYGNDAPLVLIVSFSPKECYYDAEEILYNSPFYSEDKNVEELGEHLCKSLNEQGIKAVHLKNTSQKSNLNEMKKEYQNEITKFLEKTPSISYIFDISRSIEFDNDMRLIKETITMDDKKYPTIWLASGTNGENTTANQKKSVFLAKSIAEHFNKNANQFVSKNTVSRFQLNMQFSCPSLRIDLGSYGCTFDEAILSAELFAQLFSDYLHE